MKKMLIIAITGYLVIAIVCLFLLPNAWAQGEWPRSPFCNEQFYNNAFTNGTLGWKCDYRLLDLDFFNTRACPWFDDEAPFTLGLINGDELGQRLELASGSYILSAGMILRHNSPVCPGQLPDVLLNLIPGAGIFGQCGAIDPIKWQGEHWGEIVIIWNNTVLDTYPIPNGLPHDSYFQFEKAIMIPQGGAGDFKIVLWSPAWCSIMHNSFNAGGGTLIDLDWLSLCYIPPDTPTPTVTGTPPSTSTPTATATVFCESTDYPTGTPYPSSTPYPTNTPWLTPPVLITQTPYPTYTPLATCVPTATKTPYASPTPFRFGVPLTYTNQFGELQQGMTEFFTSTEGLLGDVSGLLISASVAVSDVTSFGITNTVTISGTPVATTDMVTTFVSNMDALRYVFGWFGTFRLLAPGPFWFVLLCIAWTVLVLAIKFVSNFLATTIWPLARTVWDVVIDIWNSIPFL